MGAGPRTDYYVMKKSGQTAAKGRSRPVVPAIPLPHEKRRAAKKAAVAGPVPIATAEDAQTPSSTVSDPAQPATPGIEVIEDKQQQPQDLPTPLGSQHGARSDAQTPQLSSSERSIRDDAESSKSSVYQRANGVVRTDPLYAGPGKGAYTTPTPVAEPHSSSPISPSFYNMPPPFHPASRNIALGPNHDGHPTTQPPPPMPGPYHMPHQSNGSVQFGAYIDSQTSSPAPPPSAGFPMPPPNAQINGHPNPMHPLEEPLPRPHPAVTSLPPNDAQHYNGQVFRHAEPVLPGPNGQHIQRDHRYPGEQPPEPQFLPGMLRNGHAHSESIQSHVNHGSISGPPGIPAMNSSMTPPHHMMASLDAGSLLQHVQHQFSNPDFSDCTLEIRFQNEQYPPVRIPAHQIILLRSPRLFELLQRQQSRHSPSPMQQTLSLDTDDKWIHPNPLYMAVQTLYGLPLLPMPPRNSLENPEMQGAAGSAQEQFTFALAYIASGHLLQWQPVVQRGYEVAGSLISWRTVPLAMEFALDNHQDKGSHLSLQHGKGSEFLLFEIIKFTLKNLHLVSAVDSATSEQSSFKRLPAVPNSSPVRQESPKEEESTVQFGQPRHAKKISGIQFGDLSVQDGHPTPTMASSQPQIMYNAAISHILLELPFHQLKILIDTARHDPYVKGKHLSALVRSVIAERESRRQQAVQSVQQGQVPNADSVKRCLSSAEPYTNDHWGLLGWQEWESHDGLTIGRTWVPLQDGIEVAISEYP